jgi:hypothetical protein
MTLMPLPFMNPLNPSSLHILAREGQILPYACPLTPLAPLLAWTCLVKL